MPVCPALKEAIHVQVFNTAATLAGYIINLRKENPVAVLGFVPTMGALHEGHISLIKAAKAKCDVVICSIFVNPTQFNNAADLAKYPRTLESDLNMLKVKGCDLVYTPEVEDIYPKGTTEPYSIDFEGLDEYMEGAFRPGHFKGVAQVVERLFRIVTPDIAFFGRKDFQQTAIIKKMVKIKALPVEIVVSETLRSSKGLALSSRNQLLSEHELKEALIIYETLQKAKILAEAETSAEKLKNMLIEFFNQGNLKLEYLEIVSNENLAPIDTLIKGSTCCIAAYCGSVRLIDNMEIF